MRRLAYFWLICAATGFAAAACVAFVLSLAIDHRLSWQRPVPIPIARVLENLQSHPGHTLDARSPVGG